MSDYIEDQLPYDWESEEAQGTKEQLRSETVHNDHSRTTVTLLDDGKHVQLLVERGYFSSEQAGATTLSETSKDTRILVDPSSIEAFQSFLNVLPGIQARA